MEGGDLSVSATIDTKVVEMKFDNAEFETRVAQTMKSLAALNKGLQLEGATKGLQDLGKAGQNVNLSGVEAGVQNLADKFKALSVIGITALATIAHQAIATGAQLVKSLTIQPIADGYREYETNLNSIQTILANTGLEGAAGLARVTQALDELNRYSDQTIYNFSEMARNIGTFTAAGVKLDVATGAIKGIANLAAISGSNAEQASAAMYQLSQALAAGKLTLMDWNSVVNAGLGGKVFQNALIETARVHGVAIDDIIKKQGSFRASLEKGWITAEILTETLNKFTGDLSAQQLKQMGYTDKQIADIIKLGKTAQDAATKVKTFTQLIGTLREAVGSGWARTWQILFGDFDEAKELFTGINDVIGGFINKSSDARNKLLGDWKELGGRTVLLDAVKNAFQALIAVVTPIKDAFHEIFPPITAQQLYNLTVSLRNFTSSLKISADTGMNLRRTFAGIFALFDIGWMIVKEGIGFLLRLFGVVTEGSGSVLEFTGNIGDFIVGLRNAIKQGDGIHKFFEGLSNAIEPVIRFLKSVLTLLGSIFDGFNGQDAAKSLTSIPAKLNPLEKIGAVISKIWGGVFHILDNVVNLAYKAGSYVSDFLQDMGIDVSKSLQGINFEAIVGAIGGGAFTAFILSLRTIGKNVGDIFDGITDSLGAMQHTLRAATLVQIALAIGLLAGSVLILSKVDAAGLASSLTALTVMFGQLLGFMLAFEKFSGFKGFAKMPFVAASMILLGVAINLLALAAKQLFELDWEELGRGLTGLAGVMALVVATAHLMPNPAGMISTSIGLTILAVAIKLLVDSVKELSEMNWEELAKGLVGVGVLLGALTLFSRFAMANAGGVLAGAGIILLATGIKILVSAVKDFAEMSWAEIGRGLTVLGGALLGLGLALALVPPTAPLVAAGFLILAPALIIIAEAVKQMSGLSWAEIGRGMTVLAGALLAIGLALGLVPPTAPLVAAGFLILAPALLIIGEAIKQMAGMSWEEIGKGMTVLAGALLAIGLAVSFMTGAVAGAAALLIVAGSLAILAPILQMFSQMSWEEIAKGLAALAGVFLVIGVAGLVLAGIVPALLGLGLAITLIGVGVLAAGAGVFLFAAALTALSIAAASGTLALVAMVGALAGLIPTVMKQIGLGIVAFAQAVASASPAMIAAIVAILMALLTAIDQLAPKIIDSIYRLLTALLDTIIKYMPHLVDVGLKIVIAFINGVASKIGAVIDAATNLAINFIEGLQRNIPKLIQAGINYILSFLNAIADAIRANSAKMGEAGANIGTAIIEGMIRGLGGAVSKLVSKAVDIAKSALNAAKSALGISSPSKEFEEVGRFSVEGLALGLEKNASIVEDSAVSVGNSALDSMRDVLARLPDIINENLDASPTIRPVLDLTDVKSNASQIGAALNNAAAFRNATVLAADIRANQTPQTAQDATAPQPLVQYNQYNTSPKALSEAEIYRQTKNQLSTTRGGLPT